MNKEAFLLKATGLVGGLFLAAFIVWWSLSTYETITAMEKGYVQEVVPNNGNGPDHVIWVKEIK